MEPAHYNSNKIYTRVSRGRLDGIRTLIGDLENKTLLDVGCGSGEVGAALKQSSLSLRVFGIDVSPQAIARAKEVLDGAFLCDIEGVSEFPKELTGRTYDVLIVSEVLEHLINPENLLTKLRMLAPVPIIVTVPNLLFWKSRLKIFFGNFTYTDTGLMDRGHIHFFSWDSLEETLKKAGYTIEVVAHHAPTRGTRTLARIFPGLFAYQFVVRATPHV